MVRRTVGYGRYDSPEALRILNSLDALLRLYTNFFQPVQKLVSKERHGARLRRRCDTPQTPYQRVLAPAAVPEDRKQPLLTNYPTLNPAQVRRDITVLQHRLIALAHRPFPQPKAPEVANA